MLKLCLTGGPGSGKTVIFNHLAQVLEERGYHVFLVPETAPELMMSGIRPNNQISNVAFQNFVLDKQLEKERLYKNVSQFYPDNTIVVIYDRGIMDIATSLEMPMFEMMLKRRGLDLEDAYDRYDAVLHLATAADGAEEFYQWNDPSHITAISNLAVESPDEAREKDKKTREIWAKHHNLHIVQSSHNFSDKVRHVIKIVLKMLGESGPRRDIGRFLIKRPSDDDLEQLGCIFRTNIVETYLHSHDPRIEREVVQRGTKDDGFTFYYVEKVDISDEDEPFITERQISAQEYANFLSEADAGIKSMTKSRRCFVHNKKYYEIDLYQFDESHAILEIEKDAHGEPDFPHFQIIKEVTDNNDFSSRSLAVKRRFTNSSSNEPSWTYETGREEIGIGKDDSNFFCVEVTGDEQKAIRLFTERGRTYLVRYKHVNGVQHHQYYDIHAHMWIND